MRRSCGLLLLIGLVVAPAGAQAEEPAPAKLIAKLGSRRFAEREAATASLMARPGPAAVQLLLKAVATSPDAEVRRRARLVLEHLGRLQETEQVLKPLRLRLSYKDVPVTQAVADFARRTGLPVVLDKEAATKLAGRKLTLETTDTTAWDAFRQLCDKAGLAERGLAIAPPQPAANPYTNRLHARGFGARQVIFLDGSNSMMPPKQDERLILVAGKNSRPTVLAGALRIQVVGQSKAVRTNLAREVTFTLNVATEPRLGWNRVIALRVETAVDSLGQRLRQPSIYVGEDGAGPFQASEVIVLWDGTSELPSTKSRQAPLRLLLGERPAQRIKELRGVLSAEVEAPAAPLARVADVFKAAGKTVKGLDGSYVKVLVAIRERSGALVLKVEVKAPPKKSDLSGLANVRILRINRGFKALERPASTLSAADAAGRGLGLLDSKGKPIDLASGNYSPGDDPNASQTYTLTYQPRQGQQGPFRFVFSGRRTVIIDVPFTLKDVPLP